MLVTIEGIDGAGKSTVTRALQYELDDVVTTSEPTATWHGKEIRRMIRTGADPRQTFLMFMFDRVYHVNEVIEPALSEGLTVVSDRYSDSTRAYQPVAIEAAENGNRSLSEVSEWVAQVMEPWNREPDLTIFVDVPIDVAMDRCDGLDKYEKREFLTKVRNQYHELIATDATGRFVVIDGTLPEEAVAQQAVDVVKRRKR